MLPYSLRQWLLFHSHYVKIGGHPGGRKLYLTFRRDFYCPAMVFGCCAARRSCTECAKNNVKLWKYSKKLTLLPACATLDFVAIVILGELTETPRKNCYLLVIAERFCELVQTVPPKRITATAVAQAFCTNWLFVYDPPFNFLRDNDSGANITVLSRRLSYFCGSTTLHITRRVMKK